MLSNLDGICGGTSCVRIASYVDFVLSIILFFLTTPLTILLIFAIVRNKHLLQRNYYLVVFNILLADCMMALFTDPMSIAFHIKEALGPHIVSISIEEQSAMHISLFFTNIVAVLSMAILAIDRMGVILSPFSYYKIMTKFRLKITLVSTWIAAGAITIIYLFIGYIRFLVVFCFSTVILTLIFMIVTMTLLRRRLNIAKAHEHQRRDSRASFMRRESCRRDSEILSSRRRTENTFEFTELDKKITKTFLWMLVLFIINYVPCVFLVVYMNLCTECNCKFVHIMRDIIWIAILASPLCRSLNFLIRLTALRDAVKQSSCLAVKEDSNGSSSMPLDDFKIFRNA